MRPSPLVPGDDRARERQERQMADRMGRAPTDLGRQAVGQLAELQGGCVASWELRWLDLAPSTLTAITEREGWTALHRGVWLLPGARCDALARTWAAVLAVAEQSGPALADARMTPDADPITVVSLTAADRAVLTAGSGAWGHRVWVGAPAVPVLLLEADHHPARPGIRVIRTRMDRFEGAIKRGGLWIAGMPRVVYDHTRLSRRRAGAAQDVADLVITADRLRVMPADDLVAMVDEPCQFQLPRRVPAVLREAAELVRPGFSHSKTEALGRRIAVEVAADLGLEVHPRPYPIFKHGRVIAEADIAVVSLRLDLEVDGPHHRTFAQRGRDRRRDAGVATIDWKVTRTPVEQIDTDPQAYAGHVAVVLQQHIDDAA